MSSFGPCGSDTNFGYAKKSPCVALKLNRVRVMECVRKNVFLLNFAWISWTPNRSLDWLIDWLIHWLVDWLFDWFLAWLLDLFMTPVYLCRWLTGRRSLSLLTSHPQRMSPISTATSWSRPLYWTHLRSTWLVAARTPSTTSIWAPSRSIRKRFRIIISPTNFSPDISVRYLFEWV